MGLHDDKAMLLAALDLILNGNGRGADGLVAFLGDRQVSAADIQRWADEAKYAIDEATHSVQNRLAAPKQSLPETQEAVLRKIQGEPLSAVEIAKRSGLSGAKVHRAIADLRHQRRAYVADYDKRGPATTKLFQAGEVPDKPRPIPTMILPMQKRIGTKVTGERLLPLVPVGDVIDRHELAEMVGMTPEYVGSILEFLVSEGAVEMVGLKKVGRQNRKQYRKKS